MKGLLFTELLEMVEEDFGYKTANAIVLQANLSSGGVYTASRSYHRTEMALLFDRLAQQTRLPFEQLAAAFGRRLCRRVLAAYPQHKAYVGRLFLLLGKRNGTPVFEHWPTANGLTVLYNPVAKTACLADGMAKGYLEQMLDQSRVEEQVLHDGRRKFIITLNPM